MTGERCAAKERFNKYTLILSIEHSRQVGRAKKIDHARDIGRFVCQQPGFIARVEQAVRTLAGPKGLLRDEPAPTGSGSAEGSNYWY